MGVLLICLFIILIFLFVTPDFDFSATVVQLKTLTNALTADEQLSRSTVEKTRILQNILLYVVSVIYNFMELHSVGFDKLQFVDVSNFLFSRDRLHEVASSSVNDAVSEARSHWLQKSVVLVMEAGGVNWLVGKVCSYPFLLPLAYFVNNTHFLQPTPFWHR